MDDPSEVIAHLDAISGEIKKAVGIFVAVAIVQTALVAVLIAIAFWGFYKLLSRVPFF